VIFGRKAADEQSKPRSFTAAFGGFCFAGGDEIEPGDEVCYVDDVVTHVGCVDSTPPAPKVVVCPTCHLTKPCDC